MPFVFLDRDGTLNEDPGYLTDPNRVRIFAGVAQALSALRKANFIPVVVSNQSAIGRGIASLEDVQAVNTRISELLRYENSGAIIEQFLFCPHRPDEQCRCRKPGTGLLEDWRTLSEVERAQSWFVGDKDIDVECGTRLGLERKHCLLVTTGEGLMHRDTVLKLGGRVCSSLTLAAELIVKESSQK